MTKNPRPLLEAGILICVNCGYDPGTEDLSGCGSDTQWAHEYVNVGERPFVDVEIETIIYRLERCARKGGSAAATAEHFADCPAEDAGRGSFVHRLYVQKTAKRLNLAAALAAELQHRAASGTFALGG